ncbi:ATP-binding protein [Streptomyces sp. NPDC046860]|uniref:ATP-binding protein n=1 Tax=Streptomyces sp. NPDC046860 TaxID=3154495 RepID=UPI0033F1D364
MSIWWSLHLRRDAASVPLARRLLIGTMETAGVDPDVSYDISVALTEACANAVEHGGTARGERSEAYRVTAYLDGEKCRIEVADSGPGVASAAPQTLGVRMARVDAEDGRGLCLIRALTDHVHVGARPDRAGTVVSFDKVLKWTKDPSLLTA